MNLKASELRIGNYLQKDLSIDDIVEIQVKIGDLLMIEIEEDMEDGTYFPIPLTQELLSDYGITFKPMGVSGSTCTRHAGHFYYGGICIMAGSVGNNKLDCFLQCQNEEIDIIYLHQLQNIPQFLLTSEELKRKV